MNLTELTGERLLSDIRKLHLRTFYTLLSVLICSILLIPFLGYLFGTAGAVIAIAVTACAVYWNAKTLMKARNPAQSRLFRKYGSPDAVARMIADGSRNIFFENGKMVMTGEWILNTGNPESFMRLEHALLAFPDVRKGGEYLIVQDCWGNAYAYPFAVGQSQVIKINVITDKIKRAAPECRIGHRPEDLEYAKSHRIPLP